MTQVVEECQYNRDYPEGWADEYPDCHNGAEFVVVATCCGASLNGCLTHVNEFMDLVGEINGYLDHPACGAVGKAGFRIEAKP